MKKFLFWLVFSLAGLVLVAPLVVSNNYFFPYIFPKALFFRVIVEVALVAYLLLAAWDKNYRPRLNLLFIIFCLFVLTAFFSSLCGVNFSSSFWGDMERSEGLILWLHLAAYFFILIGILREKKHWFWLIDFSLLVGAIVVFQGLAQNFNIGQLKSEGGVRVTAMFGNASFLAAYLILELGLALYMICRRQEIIYRVLYAFLIVGLLAVAVMTLTRGAVLGLIAGLFVVGVISFFSQNVPKSLKGTFMAAAVLIGVFGGVIYLNRSAAWVMKSPALSRLASISLTDTTGRNRLAAWQAAWNGWQNRLLFGYGLESYQYVFDKNFPPVIYDDEGSQVWFDRAHNLIFDRGVTTGFAGLALYLAFLFLPFYYLLKKFKAGDAAGSLPFIGLMVAFFVQDMFVFETITTYILLVFIWAFLSLEAKEIRIPNQIGRGAYAAAFGLALLLLGPAMYFGNIKPALANQDAATAINASDNPDSSFFTVVEQYKKALASETYGVPEYRIDFIDFVGQKLANQGQVVDKVIPIIEYTDAQVAKQLSERPDDAMSNLVAMRNYDYTYAVYADKKIERLQKALTFFPKLQELSPTRPQIYREAGYSHLYLFRLYREAGQTKLAATHAAEAESLFKKSLELNPKVYESYVSLLMAYFNTDNQPAIRETLAKMDQGGVDYHSLKRSSELAQLAINAGNFSGAIIIYEEMVKANPDNVEIISQLAKLYAVAGQDAKAIATAEELRKIPNGLESVQIDDFIKAVKRGEFKKQ